MLSCLGPRGVLGPMEFKIIWILTVRLPDKYFFQKRVLCNKKSLNLPKGGIRIHKLIKLHIYVFIFDIVVK